MSTNDLQANSDLLFCPFCGGEARIIAKPYEPKVCVGCDDDTCLGFSGLGWLYDSEKEATEAWNRRAERTCRMEYNEQWSHDEYYPTECYNCSKCGHMTYDGVPTFCPNCGAKVTDE